MRGEREANISKQEQVNKSKKHTQMYSRHLVESLFLFLAVYVAIALTFTHLLLSSFYFMLFSSPWLPWQRLPSLFLSQLRHLLYRSRHYSY